MEKQIQERYTLSIERIRKIETEKIKNYMRTFCRKITGKVMQTRIMP